MESRYVDPALVAEGFGAYDYVRKPDWHCEEANDTEDERKPTNLFPTCESVLGTGAQFYTTCADNGVDTTTTEYNASEQYAYIGAHSPCVNPLDCESNNTAQMPDDDTHISHLMGSDLSSLYAWTSAHSPELDRPSTTMATASAYQTVDPSDPWSSLATPTHQSSHSRQASLSNTSLAGTSDVVPQNNLIKVLPETDPIPQEAICRGSLGTSATHEWPANRPPPQAYMGVTNEGNSSYGPSPTSACVAEGLATGKSPFKRDGGGYIFCGLLDDANTTDYRIDDGTRIGYGGIETNDANDEDGDGSNGDDFESYNAISCGDDAGLRAASYIFGVRPFTPKPVFGMFGMLEGQKYLRDYGQKLNPYGVHNQSWKDRKRLRSGQAGNPATHGYPNLPLEPRTISPALLTAHGISVPHCLMGQTSSQPTPSEATQAQNVRTQGPRLSPQSVASVPNASDAKLRPDITSMAAPLSSSPPQKANRKPRPAKTSPVPDDPSSQLLNEAQSTALTTPSSGVAVDGGKRSRLRRPNNKSPDAEESLLQGSLTEVPATQPSPAPSIVPTNTFTSVNGHDNTTIVSRTEVPLPPRRQKLSYSSSKQNLSPAVTPQGTAGTIGKQRKVKNDAIVHVSNSATGRNVSISTTHRRPSQATNPPAKHKDGELYLIPGNKQTDEQGSSKSRLPLVAKEALAKYLGTLSHPQEKSNLSAGSGTADTTTKEGQDTQDLASEISDKESRVPSSQPAESAQPRNRSPQYAHNGRSIRSTHNEAERDEEAQEVSDQGDDNDKNYQSSAPSEPDDDDIRRSPASLPPSEDAPSRKRIKAAAREDAAPISRKPSKAKGTKNGSRSTEFPKSGPFTAAEHQVISRIVDGWIDEFRMKRKEFHAAMQLSKGDGGLPNEFWERIIDELPSRDREAIKKYCKRKWHNYRRGKWVDWEDDDLRVLLEQHGKKWVVIADHMGRMAEDCRDRYRNYLAHSENQNKGQWTEEEEERFSQIVDDYIEELQKTEQPGEPKMTMEDIWTKIDRSVLAEKMGTRTRIQCEYKLGKRREQMESGAEQVPKRKASIQSNWRHKQAEDHYKLMMPGDKVQVVQSIINLKAKSEDRIKWTLITENNKKHRPDDPWDTADRKYAFSRLKRLVPENDSFPDLLNSILKYLKDTFGNKVNNFADPATVVKRLEPSSRTQTPATTQKSTRKRKKSVAEPEQEDDKQPAKRARKSTGEAAATPATAEPAAASAPSTMSQSRSGRQLKKTQLFTPVKDLRKQGQKKIKAGADIFDMDMDTNHQVNGIEVQDELPAAETQGEEVDEDLLKLAGTEEAKQQEEEALGVGHNEDTEADAVPEAQDTDDEVAVYSASDEADSPRATPPVTTGISRASSNESAQTVQRPGSSRASSTSAEDAQEEVPPVQDEQETETMINGHAASASTPDRSEDEGTSSDSSTSDGSSESSDEEQVDDTVLVNDSVDAAAVDAQSQASTTDSDEERIPDTQLEHISDVEMEEASEAADMDKPSESESESESESDSTSSSSDGSTPRRTRSPSVPAIPESPQPELPHTPRTVNEIFDRARISTRSKKYRPSLRVGSDVITDSDSEEEDDEEDEIESVEHNGPRQVDLSEDSDMEL